MALLRALLAMPVVALVACSSEPEAVPGTPADAALAAQLQGAWCVSEDDGRTCWGFDRFEGNKIYGCGKSPDDNRNISTVASFEVSGHTACYTVISSSDPKEFGNGHKFCAKVIEVNDRFQRHVLNGKVFTTYRVPVASAVCPGAT